MKKLMSIAAALLFTVSVSTAAYAHCGSCGVGDKPKAKHACKAKCKDAKDKKACVTKCKAHNKKDHKKKGQ